MEQKNLHMSCKQVGLINLNVHRLRASHPLGVRAPLVKKPCFCSFAIKTRASNRLKYGSGLGSGSAKFIFNGLPPVQAFRRLILQV